MSSHVSPASSEGRTSSTSMLTTGGMDAMFSPLDFPEPLEEPHRREGTSSSTFLRLWATVGAILGISLIRIAPSPHGAFERALSQ